ncbi:MAG: COX aromatic rich motif-containing protein [Parachlamydiaceae bacterium]|nr:COX aromatic rich motif-containing protein [Parachlamydiaceae bacterium]
MAKKPVRMMLVITGFILLFFLLLQPWSLVEFKKYIAVLYPSGPIAHEERNLLLIIQALMLIVIVPVFIMIFVFSWIYRADNKKASYDPDLVDHRIAEYIWWGLPLVMTLIIGGISWVKTYELDPFKSIPSKKKEVTIQVVALQWKWLFIYPEENIASINFLQIPIDTPIHFVITADAPMNSFWIPHLGGQIYAMPKMKTELNLLANELGDFRGSSANISGEGFSGMHFITRVSSEDDYIAWLSDAKQSSKSLDFKAYNQIALPSKNNPVEFFQLTDQKLFDQVLMKYMKPQEKRENDVR